MTDGEERLARLERRVQALEDEAAITRMILSYGPLADSGDAEAVADLWEPDGVYDVDELSMHGREQIAAMVRSSAHQGWISQGCAHFVGPPHVTVTGTQATAVCYTLMVVYTNEGHTIRRTTANHWQLRKESGGWRVVNRTNRILDGRAESPQLLAQISGDTGEGPFHDHQAADPAKRSLHG